MKTKKCKCSTSCLENPDIDSTVKIRLRCLELAAQGLTPNTSGHLIQAMSMANTYYDWVLTGQIQKQIGGLLG